jgi:hypothetical protein
MSVRRKDVSRTLVDHALNLQVWFHAGGSTVADKHASDDGNADKRSALFFLAAD